MKKIAAVIVLCLAMALPAVAMDQDGFNKQCVNNDKILAKGIDRTNTILKDLCDKHDAFVDETTKINRVLIIYVKALEQRVRELENMMGAKTRKDS